MNKNNKKCTGTLDSISDAIIRNGDVKYTNDKVGGLKKQLVNSIMRMIGTSISPDTKTILNGLGVDASIKKTLDNGMVVTELYLRDKNIKGSKKVKVRTSYYSDFSSMKDIIGGGFTTDDVKRNANEIIEHMKSNGGTVVLSDNETKMMNSIVNPTKSEQRHALIDFYIMNGMTTKDAKSKASQMMKTISERTKSIKKAKK